MKSHPLSPEDVKALAASLRKVDFFRNLSMRDLERVLSITRRCAFPAGKKLFKQGDPGDALYVVKSGRLVAKVKESFFKPSRDLGDLGPGEIVGEMALIGQPFRTATVQATEPSELFVILAENFNSLLRDNPDFSAAIRQVAAQRKFDGSH